MSRTGNINTDHHKTVRRGRQGEGLVSDVHNRSFAQSKIGSGVSGETSCSVTREESARTTRLGRLRRFRRLRRVGKPRGLSAKQLMERRILQRHANTSQDLVRDAGR